MSIAYNKDILSIIVNHLPQQAICRLEQASKYHSKLIPTLVKTFILQNIPQAPLLIKKYLNINSLEIKFLVNVSPKGLRLGRLVLEGLNNITDKDIEDMPLVHLSCGDNFSFTDEGIRNLKQLSYLECGKSSNFTDEGIRNLKRLSHLDCGSNRNFTDEGIRNLKQLSHLDCGWNKNFTDEGIKNLKQLSYLDCGWNEKITRKGIKNLPLRSFHCGSNPNFTDGRIKHLPLQYLDSGASTSIMDPRIKFMMDMALLSQYDIEHLVSLLQIEHNNDDEQMVWPGLRRMKERVKSGSLKHNLLF